MSGAILQVRGLTVRFGALEALYREELPRKKAPKLYDRMQGTIRVSEHHADFFVENAVAVLAEERLILVVKRPESFVKVTLGA